MSKLAYHVGHYSAGSVGAIGRHNWQRRGMRDDHSNQDIDTSRSNDNMLLLVPGHGLYQAAKERIEIGCTGRITKASNWITETIVYPPEDVLMRNERGEIEGYFRDVLVWHQKEFGAANVLAAVVHLDETTPHMHTDLVPLTEAGKLSSKEVFARKNLNRQHTELASFLSGRGWDIQRGESTRDKQVRSKSVPEFKKQAEEKKIALIEEIEGLDIEVEVRQSTVNLYEEQIEPLRSVYDKLDRDVFELRQEIEISKERVTTLTVEEMRVEGVLGELRGVYADVESCRIKRTPMPLRAGKSVVDDVELDRLILQAKAYVASRTQRVEIEKRESDVFEKERSVARREAAVDRREFDLEIREVAVLKMEKEQAGLKQRCDEIESNYNDLSVRWQKDVAELTRLEQILYYVKAALSRLSKGVYGILGQEQGRYVESIMDEIGSAGHSDISKVFEDPIGSRYRRKVDDTKEATTTVRILKGISKDQSMRLDRSKQKSSKDRNDR